MKRTGQLVPELGDLQQRVASWRATRRPRSRLPEWLWRSSVVLAREHGVNRVARALRLDYYALKRRLLGSGLDPRRDAARPAFVEVAVSSSPSGGPEYRVELTHRSGGRMTLSWRGEAGAMVALAQAFWQRGQ